MKKRLEITIDEELYNYLESIRFDARQKNNSKLIEYLLLNYLIYKYKPVDVELVGLLNDLCSMRNLKEYEIENIKKRVINE